MGKIYNTRTSSLSATEANIRKTKTKKLVINDIPFAKVIDERGNSITENDLWINGVTTDENGVVTVTLGGKIDVSDWTIDSTTKNSITKVENNKAYNGDTFVCNIQTDAIENAESMFYNTDLASFNSDLSNLTDGSLMFRHCTKLTTFDSDLSSLTNGNRMFYETNLESFDSDLSSLTNGSYMFAYNTNLTDFDSDLSSLTCGVCAFAYNTNLASFDNDLSNLVNGHSMFFNIYLGNSGLSSFDSNLSSLTNGNRMFYETALSSFNSDLSSLTNGYLMFYNSALTSFNSDLSSLINGRGMFRDCSKLKSFYSDLSSLINGRGMFYLCKLDPQSTFIISDTIRDITTEKASLGSDYEYVTETSSGYSKPFGWMSNGDYVYSYHSHDWSFLDNGTFYYTHHLPSSVVGDITIGINVTNDSSTIDSQLQEFAKAAYHDSWLDLKQSFSDKGWTVEWQYENGSYITLNELDGQTTSLPIWAKLSEATEKNGNYCTEDGSKYYNISWGHDVNEEAKDSTNTDTSKFFLFGSLLEAMGYFGVIPKEYVEKNSDSSEQLDENTSN